MVRNRLPNAKEVWSNISKPALARKVLTMSKSGIHVFRICKGKDLNNDTVFIVETRNIFGMIDNFSDLFTETFNNAKDAYGFYYTCRKEAKREYNRLKEKQRKRIEAWEEDN